MATLVAAKAASGIQPKGLRVGVNTVVSTYSVGAALSVGDVIQMVKVPAGATVTYVAVSSGSGQGVVNVGDGVSTSRYMSSYLNSANAPLTPISTAYAPYTYSTDDTIDITVSLVSTGAATGGFNMVVIFSLDA